jgi:anti-sigma factor RsiW
MQTDGTKAVKISCDEVWRQISNYLEGEISVGLRARMDEHFKDCKRCTAVLVGTRNVVRLVGDAAAFDLLTAVNDCIDQKTDR